MTQIPASQLTLRAYLCLTPACGTTFQAVPSSQITCPTCGRAQVKRVQLTVTSAATTTSTAATAPSPTIPVPPKAPPPPTFKAAPTASGPVNSLAQQLQESKVGVLDPATGARTVDRVALAQNAHDRAWDLANATLPAKQHAPSAQAEVQALIRHVVNNVTATSVPQVTISFLLPAPFMGPGRHELTLAQRVTLDLSLPLREMARGVCRPVEHGNANTTFGNYQRMLPAYIEGEEIHYLEFGWRYPVPASATAMTPAGKRMLKLTNADQGLGVFAATKVAQDGYTVDAGLRLVISEWGYLFLTTDHYRSFRIYDPVHAQWVKHGEKKQADASWYQRGEPNETRKVPVSAPRYW